VAKESISMTTEEQQPSEEESSVEAERWNADAYREVVKKYNQQTARALAASINYAGNQGGDRRHWSSVIFLRILLISVSIRKLLPDIDVPKLLPWWDFASFANLVRALFELLLFFRYFTEPCSNSEWLAKLNVMQLNDCTERLRYFTATGSEKQVSGFKNLQADLIQKLEKNSVIQAIDEKRRKKVLEGWRPSILSQREIAEKFNIPETFWSYFQFLSTYTHSLPMSFYRTYEQKRDGTENEVDRGYFIVYLDWIGEMLKEGIDFYEKDMDEVKSAS
jgi:hypothetical protein